MKPVIFILGVLTFMCSSLTASPNTSEKKPRIGVACVVQKDGKVLLGQRKGAHGVGSWATPGGHLEFGESVEACATRELLEETGLKPLSLRLGPWVENLMEDGQKHYITIFVFIDDFVGEPVLLEPDKCEAWKWVAWDNLPQPLFPSISSVIAKEPTLFYQTATE
ncbi:MAG: NUDIX domain-containing protein [Chlamydiales bacterium]|nr:NUDIX domain-containing protein [Chlamydiales bacterium]